MAQSKADRLAKLHQEALEQFDRIQAAVRYERIQCLQDRRFYSIAGAQWEGPLAQQFENRPMMEINKIHLSVIRIINDYRNNRVDVSFSSKDGEDRDDLAETCQMLYRADEQESTAEEAYDNAFEEAVGGGFGAWRLRTDYVDEYDEDDDKQRILIDPIYDADSCVFFDLDAKRQDKKDAKHCFVLTSMTPSAFEDEYGYYPEGWDRGVTQAEFDWYAPDLCYVAEYYKIEEKKETLYIYRGLDGSEQKYSDKDFEEDENLSTFLGATGFREVRQKKITKRQVHKYLLAGDKCLEDCGVIAGTEIPIIPVYGKRWFIDGIERMMGHVRLAKDSQRLKNMQLSKLAEIAASSSVQKPIFTPEQISGHEVIWQEDNLRDYPYLTINAVTGPDGSATAIGPAAYTQSPQIPPALAALLQITEQDMQDILGRQEAAEEVGANMSGKAVELIQTRLDMQTYIYISNFAKAIKRSGEVWLSMAKDILIEEGRKTKGLTEQGKATSITLMTPTIKPNGAQGYENDLSEANFDVVVDVGPSSDSKRQATVRALTGMMTITQDPETLQVLSAMAMMNMEGEGIDDVREYFRNKLLRMGVVKPTDEEMQQLQAEQANKQPDPNSQYLMAASQQAEADAARARAETVLSIAKAEKTKAETAETLAGISRADREQVVSTVKTISEVQKGGMPTST